MKNILISSLLLSSVAFAHTPIMYCFDNGDNTITCEGGFSDGSSGAGTQFSVKQDNKTIVEGKLTETSDFTFKKPTGNYTAIFDAGKGHIVEVQSDTIVE